MEIEHFSHEHPLILKEEHQHDNTGICYGCLEAIKGGGPSYYTCSTINLGCDFYLHESCAKLPLQTRHHPLHPEHPLTLLVKTDDDRCCNNCGGPWKNFTYNCSICDFDLDIFCAFPTTKRKIEHRIHKHPLILLKWLVLLPCDACGTEHEEVKGSFYTCPTCIQSTSTQFFIHKDCALLPSTLKHSGHDHVLSLAHSLSLEYSQFLPNCDICNYRIKPEYWVYCCGGCRYFAHINCATSNKEISKTENETPKTEPFMLILESCSKTDIKVGDFINVIHLPVADQSVSLISLFLKEMKLEEKNRDETTKLDHYSHEHSLTLFNVQTKDGEYLCSPSQLSLMNMIENNERCHGCMQYISSNSPFYSCVQCKFLLHKCCAELPMEVTNPMHPQHPLFLIKDATSFHELFLCTICTEGFTGLGYICDSCDYIVDVKCGLLPGVITHEAHPQHLLVLRKSNDKKYCIACRVFFRGEFTFECNTCNNFRLHIHCALLPRTIRHRYDKLHPFVLTYSPVRDHPDEYLCELCERDIDPKEWFYHCVACDLSIHVDGISGCGKFSNIMFGVGTMFKCHHHRLTLLPKTTKYSLCDLCGIDLTRDLPCVTRPVLECSLCNFKIHFACPGPTYVVMALAD